MILKPNAPEAAHAGKTIQGFNYINGKEVEGVGHIESRSAVDDRDLVGIFPDSGEQDVENAAKAAAKAFKTWSATPSPIRGAVIQRIGQILAEQKDKLAHIITREIGKTPREAAGEVQEAIDTCTFFTSEGRRLYGQTVPSEMAHKELYTYRRPIGVCGILAANNFPMAVP
ncbi:MAG: aldehyde dehydrogenase family protein, partial [Acidobacteriota bacterium]|nr:aldehyde dehydrogenase family protein [Acidobacteriota bacterium]